MGCFATLGGRGGRTGGTKAQCFFSTMVADALSGHEAPSSIQRRSRAIVASGKAGCWKGMRGSSCWPSNRWIMRLSALLPGTITVRAVAFASKRVLPSGFSPEWQV